MDAVMMEEKEIRDNQAKEESSPVQKAQAREKAPQEENQDNAVDPEMTPIEPVSRNESHKLTSKMFAGIAGKKKAKKVKGRGIRSDMHFSQEVKTQIRELDNQQDPDGTSGKLGALAEGERLYTNSDTFRLWNKDELLRSADFEDQMEHTKEFQDILDLLRAYARCNVTGDEDKEAEQKAEINNFKALMTALEAYRHGSARDDDDVVRERDLAEAYYQRLQPLQRGELSIDQKDPKVRIIDKRNVKKYVYIDRDATETVTMRVVPNNEPLFPHEPSMNDVRQVGLNDCFLLATLANVAGSNPELIKGCMNDDGRGTITVRLYDVKQSVNAQSGKPGYSFSPVYVRVKKQVPLEKEYAKGALWPQLFEQAYAAARLGGNEFKTKDIQNESPEQKKKNDQRINYGDAEGGDAGWFMMQLKGKPLDEKGMLGTISDLHNTYEKLLDRQIETEKNNGAAGKYDTAGNAEEAIQNTMSIVGAQLSANEAAMFSKFTKVAWISEYLFNNFKLSKKEHLTALSASVLTWLTEIYKKDTQNVNSSNKEAARLYSYDDYMAMIKDVKANDLSETHLSGIRKDIKAYIEANKKDKDGNPIDGTAYADFKIREIKSGFLSSFREMLRNNKDLFVHEKQSRLSGRHNSLGEASEGSGPDEFYQYVAASLKARKTVMAATRLSSIVKRRTNRGSQDHVGNGGEQGDRGIFGGHAYSVIGVRTRGSRRYIMLRNPWARGIREYVLEKGKIEENRNMDLTTHGIFLVDINNFYEYFSKIMVV